MKIRYWMVVYPFQMQEGSQIKPSVSGMPIEAGEGAKLVTFDVFVPDNLFGAELVATEIVASLPSGDAERP